MIVDGVPALLPRDCLRNIPGMVRLGTWLARSGSPLVLAALAHPPLWRGAVAVCWAANAHRGEPYVPCVVCGHGPECATWCSERASP